MTKSRHSEHRYALIEWADGRRGPLKWFGGFVPSLHRDLWMVLASGLSAGFAGYFAFSDDLSGPQSHVLFILVLASGLWITEAVPAFAVGLLVIVLEILLLADVRTNSEHWQLFVAPWASPVIWLFLGSFVMAKAAEKTGLDRLIMHWVLRRFVSNGEQLLAAYMLLTFFFSMFISNTATAVVVIATVMPVLHTTENKNLTKAILLGVALSANLGGMGTIIGTPPNAIVAGMLSAENHISFFEWMGLGLPPALVLLWVGWILVRRKAGAESLKMKFHKDEQIVFDWTWQHLAVVIVFFVTILLWTSESLHGVPMPVVAFLPLSVFTLLKIVDAADMRTLGWDVLILIAGGLALGFAIETTGLAKWMVGRLPYGDSWPIIIIMVLALFCSFISNVMSNTAAASLIAPLAMGMASEGNEALFAIPVALAASSAMLLPIATPPNAIAFSHGELTTKDFLTLGLPILIVEMVIGPLWVWWFYN